VVEKNLIHHDDCLREHAYDMLGHIFQMQIVGKIDNDLIKHYSFGYAFILQSLYD